MLKKSPLYLSHILNISLEKNDILLQYSGEFIVYNGSWQYHLIIIEMCIRDRRKILTVKDFFTV